MGEKPADLRAVARIDHDALRANFAEAQTHAGGCRVIAVVKADAYGHGAVPVARTLLAAGCEQLAVVGLDEAIVVREAGVDASLLVLGGLEGAEAAQAAVLHGCEVVVHHPSQVDELAAVGARVGVHVEVDSGMHRMGVPAVEAGALVRRVAEADTLELAGLMTHLARADEADLAPSIAQLEQFRRVVEHVRAEGAEPRWLHVGNSAGLLAGEALRTVCPGVNAVRPGLMLYGARPGAHLPGNLQPVMTLTARVAQVRAVSAGGAVGYGAEWRADRATHVATVACGYADGVPLSAGNRGSVRIGGARFPIVGRVSMDFIGVDVGNAPIAIGDEVLLFGALADGALPVEEAAEAAGTHAYELLTRVGARVPRVHVGATE